MKQFKPFWAILAAIAFVIAVVLLPQCASPTPPPPCNLPAPQTVRLDSFKNGKAYLSWTQVAGNNGYRIKVVAVDSPSSASALRDTSVEINDTNVVILNLPRNTLLEFQVSAKCSDGNSSKKSGTTRGTTGVIVDEAILIRQSGLCPLGQQFCYTIDNKPVTVNFQKFLSPTNAQSLVVLNFNQTIPRHYHIIIKKGSTVVSEFRLIFNLSPNVNLYTISKACSINPVNAGLDNVGIDDSFEWSELGNSTNKLRLKVSLTNQLILESDQPRDFTVYRSTKYTGKCK
jgi:hypothetical protein